MSHGSWYPPDPRTDGRRGYDSYNGYDERRDSNRDRDRNGNGRDRHNNRRTSPPRGADRGGDSYRPQPYSHRDDFHNSQGYQPPPPSYSQPPPPPRDDTRPPQSEFSFRFEKPAGVQDTYDSYRPDAAAGSGEHSGHTPASRLPLRPPGGPSYRPQQGNRRGRGGRGGRGGGYVRFKAAERPMLNPLQSNGPEQYFFDAEAGATYRPLDDLSDSDEADMDISEGEGDAAEPSVKRARLSNQKSAAGDSVPKWSNPDPYTALPPPDPPGKPRKDVVQLIRKSRVETTDAKASIPAEAADFIPCDFDDSDEDGQSDVELIEVRAASSNDVAGAAVPGGSSGPRFGAQQPMGNARSGLPDSASLPPQPTQPLLQKPDSKTLAPPTQPSRSRSTDNALGSRKRTHDDEIKLPAHAKLKKVTKVPGRGALVHEWKAVSGEDPRPWLVMDHSRSTNMGNWLHKEIVDFYEHIRPRDFEERIRSQLVQQLKKLCRDNFRDAELYPFGSFPSGLYLPTGDLDLVLCSDAVYNGAGFPKYSHHRTLYMLRNILVNSGVAASDKDVELIRGAKVPLVKFIDSRTGLKVDVSFENTTGITAIETFKYWKEQYPAMPVLVTLVKHFLAMRGLNEPVNGGIGGFSVICLVVSMLQQMPDIQSRSKKGELYYGDLLMAFFDLYGNRFNYQTMAISLNPPGYIPKHRVTGFTYKNVDRLSIIDPNNAGNDISGGSSNTATIVALFAEAYRDLRERMATLAKADKTARQRASILEVIFAGNYSTFRLQREHLAKLDERGLGPQPEYKQPAKRSRW